MTSLPLPHFRLVTNKEEELIPEVSYFIHVFRVSVFIRTDIDETLNTETDITHYYIDEGQFKQRIDYTHSKIELKNKERFQLSDDDDDDKDKSLPPINYVDKIHYFPRLKKEQVTFSEDEDRAAHGFFNKILSLITIFQLTRWFKSYYSVCIDEVIDNSNIDIKCDSIEQTSDIADWWESNLKNKKIMSPWKMWQVGLFVNYTQWYQDMKVLMEHQQEYNYNEQVKSHKEIVCSLQELYGVQKGKEEDKQKGEEKKEKEITFIPLSTLKTLGNGIQIKYYILKQHNMIPNNSIPSETLEESGKQWFVDWVEELLFLSMDTI